SSIRTTITASMNNASPDTRSKLAMNKHITRSTVKNRSDSTASAESTDTVEAAGSQEIQEPSISNIEIRMRTYVDTAIQTASASLMQSMQQFMNQQAEAQREWSSQLLETVNQRLPHVSQTTQNI
ncbi:13198_t:CDS:1, partial [Cetraspora pellucida]